MAFNPNSTIRLCGVPFDSTYKNVVYFDSLSDQQNYFLSKTVKTFSEYVTVRETLPDGTLRSSVKVEMNIDALRALGINYMWYTNGHSGAKYFYAFITQMVYINEETTKIIFETDVFQTWRFEAQILDSFVEREHSKTDVIGENLVPEKFNFQDYVFQSAHEYTTLDEWGYLVGSTVPADDDDAIARGRLMSGIYQGLYYYFFYGDDKVGALNSFLDNVEEKKEDAVQFVCVMPSFNKGLALVSDNGYVPSTISAAQRTIKLDIDFSLYGFEGYKPDNKKLFTSPYHTLIVTNNNGDQVEYPIEDFNDANDVSFTLYGDISANPSLILVPRFYRGIYDSFDHAISIKGFPQCSFNNDNYKLWLAKNQYSQAINYGSSIVSILAGIAAFSSGGSIAAGASILGGGLSSGAIPIGQLIGASQIGGGVRNILSTMNENYMASRQANSVSNATPSNNLLTSQGKNKFTFLWKRLKRQYVEMIDQFFTMYGYQTNKVKKPNLNSRPYFNYVKTVDINIIGNIPSDEMMVLKAIYDRGVTLWKPNAVIGDYSVDNSPD